MSRPRVLIADDHADVVKAVGRLLAIECDVVGVVADGSALLEAAQRLEPDVVVLDLNLPKVNGLEACQRITRRHPATKVVVFTAMNDPELKQRAFDAGAAAFVFKMAGDGDLLGTVKRLHGDRASSTD